VNTYDVLKYGHLWVLKHIDGFTQEEWEAPGVCGVWSVKEIVAHLASFEKVLEELLTQFLSQPDPTPNLDQFIELRGDDFNAVQVGKRKDMTPEEVVTEYSETQARNLDLVKQIPQEFLRQPGTLPWYGMEYALDDFIVYTFYGHKREHCAQIAIYRDRLKES
jgi:hypothetical protein